jgi:hypothetical protein
MKKLTINKQAVAEAAYLVSRPNYGGAIPYINTVSNEVQWLEQWTFDANHIPVSLVCPITWDYDSVEEAQLACADSLGIENGQKKVRVYRRFQDRRFQCRVFHADVEDIFDILTTRKTLEQAIACSEGLEPRERFLTILEQCLNKNKEYLSSSLGYLIEASSLSYVELIHNFMAQSELPKKQARKDSYQFWYVLYGASLVCFA